MLYNKTYLKYKFIAYMKYDNYDAIEIPSINLIPSNFYGIMGVPLNFLLFYNPKQFEIVGTNNGLFQDDNVYGKPTYLFGKETFRRLFIKNIMNSSKQLNFL